MIRFKVVYGYIERQGEFAPLDPLLDIPNILKFKSIGVVVDSNKVEWPSFAALVRASSPLALPSYIKLIPFVEKKKTLSLVTKPVPAVSRKRLTGVLNNEVKKEYARSCRRYRKLKNQTLTENNWRQHVHKKAALRSIEQSLNSFPTYKVAL